MSVVLFVNSYDLRVFASTDYNHNELLEYPGYAEAMYESIVEETTFISGRYTENKEYVNQSINQITDYAKGWWDEYMSISNMEPKEKIREMINAAGGYALTVGDFIKKLFTDYDKTTNTGGDDLDFSGYEQYLSYNPNWSTSLSVKSGYTVDIAGIGTGLTSISYSVSGHTYTAQDIGQYRYSINNINVTSGYQNTTVQGYIDLMARYNANVNKKTLSGHMANIHAMGKTLVIKKSGVAVPPISINRPPQPSRVINNYINENPPSAVIPQPKAYLSCPDGTRINMKINGGTFLDIKGNIMSVDKNGTATVDSQICNLGWEKPKIQYVDGTDQVGISTPDDGIIDAETGETIVGGGDDEFDDEIKDGCGTLCALGKLLSGLGSIVKAIAAIPLKILDGLLELFKKIIVPPDGFWTKEIEEIEKQFFKDEIKENIDSLKDLGGAGGGQFQDVSVSLMGVDNVTVVDSDSINMSLDTIHGWVRGIFYPLLLFFNISMLYRLIRGTSFVGIGETKGGGDK